MKAQNNKRYTITLEGRAGILYSEGSKKVVIDSEMLVGPTHDFVIWLSKLKNWDPPDDASAITDEDKDRIKSRIIRKLGRASIDWQ